MGRFGLSFPVDARRRVERDLPAAAQRMGLHFTVGKYMSEIGTISGTYQAHSVLVRPAKPAIIVEYRTQIDGVEISA